MSIDLFGSDTQLTIEVAWGADLTDTAGTGWTWSDITADVRQDPGVSTRLGRADEASTSQPAELELVLTNTAGAYSLGGWSQHYPFVRRGTPVRVSVRPDDGVRRVLFFGYASGWQPGWDSLTGKVPVTTLTASGTLRRLAQGANPVTSAYRRAMEASASVVAYWPLEDGKDASFLECVRGGSRMTWTAEPKLGVESPFVCSAAVVEPNNSGFTSAVDPYTPTAGRQQVRFLMSFPEDGLDDGSVLLHLWLTGSIMRADVAYEIDSGTGILGFYFYDRGFNLVHSQLVSFDVDGFNFRMSFEFTQNGADLDWSFGVTRPEDSSAGYWADTLVGHTAGVVNRIELTPWGQASGTTVSHLTVENTVSSLFSELGPLTAFRGEYPATGGGPGGSRIARLCDENNVALAEWSVPGPLYQFEQMGPQRAEPLLDLLRECEEFGQGQIWDGRTPGIAYTLKVQREEPDGTSVPLDKLLEFAPVDDDQRTRNRVQVTQRDGASATFEDVQGPLGTAAVGVYDDSLAVNALRSDQARQHAAWRVGLGTVHGYRLPTVAIDLRAHPELAAAALDLVPGHRLIVTGVGTAVDGFPREDLELIVEGIAHAITAASWVVRFTCSSWRTWAVGWSAAEDPGDDTVPEMVLRGDTTGAVVVGSPQAGSTSLVVTTTSGPRWTTDPDDFPLELSVGGVKVRATACTGATSTQTFTIDPLPVSRSAGAAVELWSPRPLGV